MRSILTLLFIIFFCAKENRLLKRQLFSGDAVVMYIRHQVRGSRPARMILHEIKKKKIDI